MPWKYIKSVGLELEAGFKNKRMDLHTDDSLRSSDFVKSAAIGELISDPINSEEEVIKWIKDSYSDVSETPACAAFHIHVSFKHINYYSQCMNINFYNRFMESIEKWGKDFPIRNPAFWDRLHGKNKYCVPEFRAETQVKCRTKDEMRKNDLRRTVLNYCFGLHKTIENRLFPTFIGVDTTISATLAYLAFIEDFLDKNPISEDEIKMEIVDEGVFYEADKGIVTQMRDKIALKPFNLYTRNKQKKLNKNKSNTLINLKQNPLTKNSGELMDYGAIYQDENTPKPVKFQYVTKSNVSD